MRYGADNIPIPSSGCVRNVCQPPIHWRKLVDGLTEAELADVIQTMVIYAPDVFERALKYVSEFRAAGDSP